jgi:phage shock protein C
METQKRLFRSDDAMIGGVCAGIAEYFDIDPTIVRIIAVVLVILGIGAPIVIYFIAWLIMPRRPKDYVSYIDVKPAAHPNPGANPAQNTNPAPTGGATGEPPSPQATQTSEAVDPAQSAGFAPPSSPANPPGSATPPTASRSCGCGSSPGTAYTSSNSETFDAVDPNAPAENPNRQRTVRSAISLGILLVALGLVALLGTLVDITLWRLWPLVLIIAGIIMLFTPGSKGWSIERAGHAIVLVAIGFALQICAIGIIPVSTFVHCLVHLWPVLLVIGGLAILGSALQKGVFNLLGSLIFSVTLILGVWCYGQITQPIEIDLPGDRAIVLDLPNSPEFTLNQNADRLYWVWR